MTELTNLALRKEMVDICRRMNATGINRYFRDARANRVAEGATELHNAIVSQMVLGLDLATALQLLVVIVLVIAPILTVIALAADRARRIFRSQVAIRRINRTTAGVMAGAAVAMAAKKIAAKTPISP